jgi:hypothetical protein
MEKGTSRMKVETVPVYMPLRWAGERQSVDIKERAQPRFNLCLPRYDPYMRNTRRR